jgi:NAD-dependent DNA ligase
MNSLFKFASLYLPLKETETNSSSRELNPHRLDVDRLLVKLHHEDKSSTEEAPSTVTREDKNGNQFLQGRRVVFSGRLNKMTRDEACTLVERQGSTLSPHYPLPNPLLPFFVRWES